MITGSVADSTLSAPAAGLNGGLKVVPIAASAILVGHADAVDQAIQRIAHKDPPPELTRLAEMRQARSDFWAIGSARLIGPQALSAGMKRFSLTVWVRDRLTGDMTLEFNGVPSANTLRTWQAQLGGATVEGNSVHAGMSMETDEVQQKFSQLAAGPLGQGLVALVAAARYLPVRDNSVSRPTKPMIYGLDDGPKEVNQYPVR